MVMQQEMVRRIAENRRLIDDLIKPEIFPAVAAPVPLPVALNDMLIADATPVWIILTGPAAQGEILVAGAAPFTQVWGTVNLLSATHGDTTPQAVSRGSLIYGDAAPSWNELVIGAATNFLRSDGVDAAWSPILVTDLPAHDLLSAQHGDTVVQAVNRGSLVYGDATPDWNELVIGAASAHLESDGADVAWQANLTMADDTWIGLGGAAGRLVFDATPAPDQVEVTDADLNFVTAAHGIIHVDGVVAGNYLRADGTRYVPNTIQVGDLPAHNLLSATHGDTVVQGATRGSLVYGDATPAWNELVIGALSTHLESDGVDVTWQANITMADDAWIGLSVATARIVFDDTPAGDNIRFDNCGHVGIDNLLEHNGDLDTYLIFSPDFAGFRVGNVDMLQMQELAVGQDNVTINPTGADVDFIVEAMGQPNALFVRGSDGYVGIGTNLPATLIHAFGAAARVIIESSAAAQASLHFINPSIAICQLGGAGAANEILVGTAAGDFALTLRSGGAIRISADVAAQASAGINLLENGNVGIADLTPTGGRLSIINNVADNGAILHLYRNQGTVNQSGFYMRLANVADDEAAMTIRHDGTGELLQLFQGAGKVCYVTNNGYIRPTRVGVGIAPAAGIQIETAGVLQALIVRATGDAMVAQFLRDVDAPTGPVVNIEQQHATGLRPPLALRQADVSQAFIEFVNGTIYTGRTEADEYLKITTSAGTRYLRCFT